MTARQSSELFPASRPVFATTHWTQVLAARGVSQEARQALNELCAAYYAPVVAFVNQTRHGAADARDLTHEFFAKLLSGHGLDGAERTRGRFRSYLLGAVKHFLADIHDRQLAAKRGVGRTPISLDAAPASGDSDSVEGSGPGLQIADPRGFPPDAFFDRQWALNVLDRVLAALAHEHDQAGKAHEFAVLKPWLTGDSIGLSLTACAERLKTSEGAAKVAVHRLRKRFRQLVKTEIAATVADESEIAAEMAYLIEALSHARP